MAVFSEGGWTSPDLYVGVTCICLVVLCTFLNSLVLVHNYHKSSSVARNLYICLSATDLSTAWIVLLPFSVNVLKIKDEDDLNRSDASLSHKLHAVITWTINVAPNHITAFLALARYTQIKYPFRLLHTKHILTALVLSLAWAPLALSSSFLYVHQEEELYQVFELQAGILTAERTQFFGIQMEWRTLLFVVFTVTAILQLCAIVASLLTIYELVKSYLKPAAGVRRNHNTKSTLRIIITNFGSFIYVTSYVNSLLFEDGDLNQFSLLEGVRMLVTTLILPSLLSTVNPIFYISFTSGCSFKLRAGESQG